MRTGKRFGKSSKLRKNWDGKGEVSWEFRGHTNSVKNFIGKNLPEFCTCPEKLSQVEFKSKN